MLAMLNSLRHSEQQQQETEEQWISSNYSSSRSRNQIVFNLFTNCLEFVYNLYTNSYITCIQFVYKFLS